MNKHCFKPLNLGQFVMWAAIETNGAGGNEIRGSQDKLFPTNTNLHLSGSIASASGRKLGERGGVTQT